MAVLSTMSVMFTANADGVRRGTNEAKTHISSYGKWAGKQGRHNPFSGATAGAKQFGGVMSSMRSQLAGFAGTFAAAFGVGAIASSIKDSLAFVDSQAELAQQLDVSIKSLSGLSYITEVVGGNTEALGSSIAKVQKLIGNAANGQDAATKTLEKYGFTAKELLALPLEEQIGAISDKFKTLESQEQKVVMATDFFGKSGADMINVLSLGSKEIGNMIDKAEGLGLVFTDSMAKKASDAEDAMLALNMATKGLSIELANSLAPALGTAATKWSEWISALRESEAITDVFKKVMGATKLTASVATLIPSAAVAAVSDVDMKDTWAADLAASGFADFDSTKAARLKTQEKQIGLESQRAREAAVKGGGIGAGAGVMSSVPPMLAAPMELSPLIPGLSDLMPQPELGPVVSDEAREDFKHQWDAAKDMERVWDKINAEKEKEAKEQEALAKAQQKEIEKAAKEEKKLQDVLEKQTEEKQTQLDMEGDFMISKAGRVAAGGSFTTGGVNAVSRAAMSTPGGAGKNEVAVVGELQKQTTLLQAIAAKPMTPVLG